MDQDGADAIVIAGDGITLDLLLWRRFGVAGQAMVEATYEINPRLAIVGPDLPLGLRIVLPPAPVRGPVRARPVSLFG